MYFDIKDIDIDVIDFAVDEIIEIINQDLYKIIYKIKKILNFSLKKIL